MLDFDEPKRDGRPGNKEVMIDAAGDRGRRAGFCGEIRSEN